MNTKAISFGLMTAGLLLGSASPSFADHKTYAASECEVEREFRAGHPS